MAVTRFPVEYAVLGVLMEGSAHGYELQRRLTSTLGSIWHIATSQLYSVLHRLVERGLLSMKVEPQQGRPPRKVYTITPQGEEAFGVWVATPVRHMRDVRVELLAKLYFLHRLAPEKTGPLIDQEVEFLERLRDRLSRRKDLPTDDQVLGRLALRFRLSQVESAIRWLGECRAQIVPSGKSKGS